MDKQVDVVVLAGDWYDMPSLSSYDRAGSKRAEGRRVIADLDAGHYALAALCEPWKKRGFAPELHVTLGNHEDRLNRAVNDLPALLDGMLSEESFRFAEWGFCVHRFLQPVTVDGIRYCHLFPHNARGQVTQTKRGAPSALAQVQRQMCSATAGHQQGLDVAAVATPDGMQRGLIAGSCYLHDEDYMGPLNNYWRGVIVKNDVRDGNYNLMEVDLGYLARKYRSKEPANARRVA